MKESLFMGTYVCTKIRERYEGLWAIYIFKKCFFSSWLYVFRTMSVGWKVHMKMSYLLLMSFLTNEIQALKHQWKKCMNSKRDYLEK